MGWQDACLQLAGSADADSCVLSCYQYNFKLSVSWGKPPTGRIIILTPPPVPMPISHTTSSSGPTPPPRAAEQTHAVIDASVRELAGVSRLGILKKNRNK